MADLLAYHTPDTLYEATYRYRRPGVLWAAIGCLLAGTGLGYLGWVADLWRGPVKADGYACGLIGVMLAAAGGWLAYAYAADHARVVRFTTDGVHCPTLRPWSKIARVGGVRDKAGITPVLTLDHYSKAFGHAYSGRGLPADPRLTDAQFTALCDTLDAAGAQVFPHVWIDRTVEAKDNRAGSVSLRVLAELQKRPRRR